MRKEKKFYTRFNDRWEKELQKIQVSDFEPEIRTFQNAHLLPLRRRKDLKQKAFEGGVTTDRQKFVTGIQRSKKNFQLSFSCNKGYKVEQSKQSNEQIVFAGIIFGHFGHVIIDTCTRLWHYARHHEDGLKRIFLSTPNTDFRYGKFFDLAGINWEICTEPTRYKEIVVPDEAFFSCDKGNPVWLKWWDFLKKRAVQVVSHEPFPEKIYLTRKQFSGNDGINEEYYERYFSSLGYKVISPEQFPLEEQICIIAHAKSIVSTMGTLTHLLVFAQSSAEVTILLREPSTVMNSQLLINILKNFDWRCIEATINPLPTSQSNGAFLYVPTQQFREYCQDAGLPQPPEFDMPSEMIVQYLRKWSENYRKFLSWGYVQNVRCVDFLSSLSYFLDGVEIDKKSYTDYKY